MFMDKFNAIPYSGSNRTDVNNRYRISPSQMSPHLKEYNSVLPPMGSLSNVVLCGFLNCLRCHLGTSNQTTNNTVSTVQWLSTFVYVRVFSFGSWVGYSMALPERFSQILRMEAPTSKNSSYVNSSVLALLHQ